VGSSYQNDVHQLLGKNGNLTARKLYSELIKGLGEDAANEYLNTVKGVTHLGRRAYFPHKVNGPRDELKANQESIALHNGIIPTMLGPRYAFMNDGTIIYDDLLEARGKPKLAKNNKKDKDRQRHAMDVWIDALTLNPDVDPDRLESMAARKYEMANALGKEAHHIYPISYSGRVMSALEEVGLKDQVLKEMARRKIALGDTAQNISHLQAKSNKLGPSLLDPLDNSKKIDMHDKVHDAAEYLLGYGGLPVRTNSVEGTTIEDFIRDPNKSDYQKINYGIAVPLAHRTAMLGAADLDVTKEKNEKLIVDRLVELAGVKRRASMKLSPLTIRLLDKKNSPHHQLR